VRRLLVPAVLLLAGAAGAQEQYFEETSPAPRVTFQWDFLARYDEIYQLRVRPDIERGRFEFRPELGVAFSDRFRIAARAVGDYGTDTNADNAKNFDNYMSRGASLDRLYIEARPGPVTLLAGKFGMPLVASEMLWDKDVQTPGGAAAWEIPAGASLVTLAAAGFANVQKGGDHTRIIAGQAVWRWGDASRLAFEGSAAYWHYDVRDLPAPYLRQNYTTLENGHLVYLSNYHLVDALFRARFPAGPIPVTLSFDFIHNFGGAAGVEANEVNAFEATAALGRLGTPGQWRFFYTFQHIERDALPGAYNTDDWWFHTWAQGHRVGAGITVLPNVFVQGAVVFQRRLDRDTWLNRIMVDLVKMF